MILRYHIPSAPLSSDVFSAVVARSSTGRSVCLFIPVINAPAGVGSTSAAVPLLRRLLAGGARALSQKTRGR